MSNHRYYCRGAEGPAGHCDDQPMTIQCCYCIWKEQQSEEKECPNECKCEICRFWGA